MNRRFTDVFRPRILATVMPFLAFFPAVAGCGEPPLSEESEEIDGADLSEPTELAPEPLQVEGAVVPTAEQKLKIKSVNSTGGTGCPQGTVSATLSGDGQSLVLLFDKFVAEMGPGIPPTRNRLACNINLTVGVPQGTSFAVTQIDNRGRVDIPKDVTAQQLSTYRMQGIPGEGKPKVTQWKGPAKKNFVASNKIDVPTLVFSACGQDTNVNVATSIRLQGSKTKKSTIAIDALNQEFTQLYHFGFKKCNQ